MTEGTSSSVPIFLCCAEDSEVFLVRVVDALHKEGLAPEVIAGVEVEPSLLGEAVDRTEGAALFVLCQSEVLDKVHTRRLTGLFSARKGPQQRIITLQLYESRPLSVLPGIRNGVKEVSRAGASEAKLDAGERVNLREVVGPVGTAAVQPAAASVPSIPRDDQLPDLDGIDDAEALARELHEEMVAAEAILARRESHRRSDASQQRVEAPLPVRSTPDQETRKDPAPPPPQVSDGPEPGAPATLLDTQALATVPLGTDDPPMPSEDDEADVGPEATDPLGRSSQITGPNTSTASMIVPKRSRVGFVIAAGGVFALGLVALLYLGGEQQSAGRDERPRAVGPASPDPEAKADEPSAIEASPAIDPVLRAAGREQDDASQGDPSAPRGARLAPPPPPPVDSDAAAINEALGDGRMRALDTTLMLPADNDTMTWDGARDHCRQQRVAGVGDWRLPSKTELSRLRRARLIPVGPYWTRQKGDTDDEAFAWDARSGQYVVWLTIEPNARAVCVRER